MTSRKRAPLLRTGDNFVRMWCMNPLVVGLLWRLKSRLPGTAGLDTFWSMRLTREGGLVPGGALDAVTRRMLVRSDRASLEHDRTSPPAIGANASAAWKHASVVVATRRLSLERDRTSPTKPRRRSRTVCVGILVLGAGPESGGRTEAATARSPPRRVRAAAPLRVEHADGNGSDKWLGEAQVGEN